MHASYPETFLDCWTIAANDCAPRQPGKIIVICSQVVWMSLGINSNMSDDAMWAASKLGRCTVQVFDSEVSPNPDPGRECQFIIRPSMDDNIHILSRELAEKAVA